MDQRATRLGDATGHADARVVAAVRELVDAETGTSTGTRSRLIRRVVKKLEAEYGPGVVPSPRPMVSFLATFTWTGDFPGQGVGVKIYLSRRVSAFRLTCRVA